MKKRKLNICLHDDLVKLIDHESLKHGLNRSSFLTFLILEYFRKGGF